MTNESKSELIRERIEKIADLDKNIADILNTMVVDLDETEHELTMEKARHIQFVAVIAETLGLGFNNADGSWKSVSEIEEDAVRRLKLISEANSGDE
jgi:hypothetical protein